MPSCFAPRFLVRAATLVWGFLVALAAPAVEVRFQPVAPHVYAFVGETEGRTPQNEALNANLGLVVTPAGAVLIDSGASFQGARQIAQAARQVSEQPIRWVINTGGQDHRWLGNGYFAEQGAEVMAHVDARADMQARGPEHLAALEPVLKDKLAGTVPTLPTRWLRGADTVLTLGGVELHVLHRHGGHTPGDSLVWLPQSGVMFAGDVVYVDRVLGLHPVSRTKPWLESFALIDELAPAVIVPGHGRVTTLAQARTDTRDLLQALRAHVGQAVEVGADIGTAVKTFPADAFMHLQHAQVWLPQLVNLTYLEMERE